VNCSLPTRAASAGVKNLYRWMGIGRASRFAGRPRQYL
jgi:hypothetical protein